jgi:hypothetical protein
MPRKYFDCWNPTYDDFSNTETTSEETCGDSDSTRRRHALAAQARRLADGARAIGSAACRVESR